MRFWLPLDQTPAWSGSRPVQALLLACGVVLIAGIAAASVVRVESPWVRIVVIAVLLPGVPLLAALLRRSERVRQHHAGPAGGERTPGPGG